MADLFASGHGHDDYGRRSRNFTPRTGSRGVWGQGVPPRAECGLRHLPLAQVDEEGHERDGALQPVSDVERHLLHQVVALAVEEPARRQPRLHVVQPPLLPRHVGVEPQQEQRVGPR